MTRPGGEIDLKAARIVVERKGIAPLLRIGARRDGGGKGGDAWARWHARQAEVAAEVAMALAAEGASVSWSDLGAAIDFAGIVSSSSIGLLRALQNWRVKAARQIEQTRRRA